MMAIGDTITESLVQQHVKYARHDLEKTVQRLQRTLAGLPARKCPHERAGAMERAIELTVRDLQERLALRVTAIEEAEAAIHG